MPGQCLDDGDVLALVDRCHGWHPIDAALAVIGATHPPQDRAALATLPLGQRDAALLALRARLVGPTLDLAAACPACTVRVEFSHPVEALFVPPADPSLAATIEIDGRSLPLRRLDSRDLAAAATMRDKAAARRELARRCLSAGDPPRDGALTDAVVDRVAERVAALDPQADLVFGLACPDCGHAWEAPFDIPAVLWRELQWRAESLLAEVHVIASRYHWPEAVVLALSPRRRAAYLRMIAA